MYVLSTNHHRLNQNTYIEEDLRYPGQACVIFKENEDGIGVMSKFEAFQSQAFTIFLFSLLPLLPFPSCSSQSTIVSFFFCVIFQFSSVQSLSRVQLFATPWIAARQASLSITISRSSPRPTSIESVMPSSHLILCCSLLLLPPIPPSIRVLSNESTLRMRWPNYWSFSFSISPSKEIPGLISFRMDWLDLLAVQGTLKSLLQHHRSKSSILQCSAFLTLHSHIHTWPQEKP